uniref:Cleavage and polyadenylation specificity factor subunit 4 n=1 Tax=Sus scrofa TaxID=9823 RepID=A0A8D1WV66_PIG
MQEVSAGLERFTFTFEEDVELQRGTGLLPFQGMDRSGSAVCSFFAKGLCHKGGSAGGSGWVGAGMLWATWGAAWLGIGSWVFTWGGHGGKGAEPAYAQRRLGFSVDCNKECPFLHVKPDFKNKDCLWFDQDFCKDGPLYKYRHVHGIMCINYLAGFCPKGPQSHFQIST